MNNEQAQDLATAWRILREAMKDPAWRETVVANVSMTMFDGHDVVSKVLHGQRGEVCELDLRDSQTRNALADHFVRNFFETKGGD